MKIKMPAQKIITDPLEASLGVQIKSVDLVPDVLSRLNGYAVVHEYQKFFMYMKKPIHNRLLHRIGYCFDLAAMALISSDDKSKIMVFSPIPSGRATTFDLLQRRDPSSSELPKLLRELGGTPDEFPCVYNQAFDYIAFARKVSITFVELDMETVNDF